MEKTTWDRKQNPHATVILNDIHTLKCHALLLYIIIYGTRDDFGGIDWDCPVSIDDDDNTVTMEELEDT